jgi:leader peptidase (prepilin peptidase)/N-methyltransferase
MHLGWALAAAAAGLLAGAAMRITVVRLSVPRGAPERTGCAGCGHPFTPRRHRPFPLAGGRCPRCRLRVGPPAATVELATGALLPLVAGTVGPRVELVAFGWLAVVGVALAAVDLAVHRLPDRLVLPGYPVVFGALTLAAGLAGDPARLLGAVAGCLVLGGCYLALVLLRPGQLGAGDLKLSGVLGLALGWLGWPAVLRGTFLAFALLSVCGLALLAARRIRLGGALPFGPFMLGGALLALLGGGPAA